MLDKAIQFLQKHLNNKLKGDAAQDKVALAKVEKDFVALATEAVTVILVNIEPDPMSRAADPYRASTANGGVGFVQPELRLNLYVMFAARFADYSNALSHIAKIIAYFQENPVLTPENAPDMDPELEKLILEIHAIPLSQQNELWGILKIAQTPAVLYRVRMVAFRQAPAVDTPAITEINQRVQPL